MENHVRRGHEALKGTGSVHSTLGVESERPAPWICFSLENEESVTVDCVPIAECRFEKKKPSASESVTDQQSMDGGVSCDGFIQSRKAPRYDY